MNELKIMAPSYEDGLFHFILDNIYEIPSTIEYSKNFDRHYIFYNCELVSMTEREYLDKSFNKRKNYRYKISYEKKFTSRDKNEVDNSFKSYIREKKLNMIIPEVDRRGMAC